MRNLDHRRGEVEQSPGQRARSEESTQKRLRELLNHVLSRKDAEEVGEVRAVIDMLKRIDDMAPVTQREVLEILQSFQSLSRSAQDRLLPALGAALENQPRDQRKSGA